LDLSFWDRVQDRLREQIPVRSFETWIRPLNLLALENEEVVLGAPHAFLIDWVEEHFRGELETAFSIELGRSVRIALSICKRDACDSQDAPNPATARPGIRQANGLNHRHTFETFVVGSSNDLACAAAQAVAEQPATVYNPLFIYGGVGLGKTHILHAIGHRTQQRNRDGRAVYVTSEDFMTAMISAIQRGRGIEFKRRYRSVDVLLIDDIEFLAGKESTQEEFFHTFNSLHEAGRQIVITCDRPPKELNGLEERLTSRFLWGLVTDIQPPDLETRVAILRRYAEFHQMTLRDDVAMLIAQNIKSNIRDLEGCLIRLFAMARNAGRPVDLPFAEKAVIDLFRSQRRTVSPRRIAEVIAQVFEIDLDELKSRKRTNAVALPRQVAMYLTRTNTGLSLADIGKEFGGRDHTTVMHACNKVQKLLVADPELRTTIGEATRILGIQSAG
jgi:chromosomal replication initiator protein